MIPARPVPVAKLVNRDARIYMEGWQLGDLARSLPNLVLLEPVKPPGKIGRIDTSLSVVAGAQQDIPSQHCLFFKVARLPERITHDQATVPYIEGLKVGDEVVVRNAMLDTMHANKGSLVDIDIRHIKYVLKG